MGADDEPSRSILVVDDSLDNRTLIVDVLGDEGYLVVTADNGDDALRTLSRIQPALILLDMWMPVMNGWQFVSAYRAMDGSHAPVVVMTAVTEAQIRAHEIGADGVLAKPFGIQELLDVVERFVHPDPASPPTT